MSEITGWSNPTTSSEIGHRHPFLRDVSIALVPCLSDDQFTRISAQIREAYPDALISRLSDFTVLVRGIPIRSGSPHDADITTWDRVHTLVHRALCEPGDADTALTSIDVAEAHGLL